MSELTIIDPPAAALNASGRQVPRIANLSRIPRESPCCRFDELFMPFGLLLRGCLGGVNNRKRWASLPSRERMENGKAVSLYGKPAHEQIAEFPDEDKRRAFLSALVAAVDAAGGYEP